MSRSKFETGLVALAVLAATGVALTGCGKRGVLDTPPPLFGERAKARYEAQQQQKAQDAADASARKGNTVPVADQPDNAPLTTRDIKAPEQKMTPASKQPIDGAAPSPFGAPVSTLPPG